MPEPVLRFAIGTTELPHSTVWRLWVHKNDVYLASRITANLIKFSMHESGEWISAFTNQSGAVIQETGSRRHKTWQRPEEFRPGWTQGPAVMAPWVEWFGEFLSLEAHPPDTIWAPGPRERESTAVSVLFSAPGVDPDEINSVSRPDDVVLGSLPLANGERVWLQSRTSEMSEHEIAGISSAEKQYRGFSMTANDSPVGGWGFWIATSPVQDIPLMIQFPLGHRHITITES